MSWTQSFTKLLRHLDKSRRLILLNQPYSQCLACQAKTFATRKLQKTQQATLKEQKLLITQGSLYKCFEDSLGQEVIWVVPWPNETLTYLQAPMELSRTLEGSLQIKKILECPTQFYVQPYVQEISRILQKALDSSHAFHHSVEMCEYLQASLEPFPLFPPMALCRWLHESPEAS